MQKKLFLLLLSLCLVIAGSACDYSFSSSIEHADLSVHYIDVGQGDSELIQLPGGRTMLIDAGTNQAEHDLLSYLDSLGISKLDYVIATHPHEDHIGSMDAIVEHYPIGEFYMSKAVTTTKTYKNLLTAIDRKGLSIHTAKAGVIIIDEPDLKAEFLAPNQEKYEDLNNYSAVVKLTYKNRGFLFTGDAEQLSEQEILKNGSDISCDVLKVGHHGSKTSTTTDFLSSAQPEIAVISCGKDNSYGHPHKQTLNKLHKYGTTVYRTDELGTVILDCDGITIEKR